MYKKSLMGFIGVACFLVIVVLITNRFETVEAQIRTDMDGILAKNPEVLLSSNPYDYIDNEYYEDIVNIGMDAVNVLEDDIIEKEEASLDGYIAALAVQDITDVNISELYGEDWETADEFWSKWNTMIETMPDEIDRILKSDKNKIEEIQKYGVFGEVIAEKISESGDTNGTIVLNDTLIDYDLEKTEIEEARQIIESEEGEIDQAEQYLEDKLN
ncbi:MAG: hypothetical protein K6G65_11020 [Lachnospiraceae bacterium]|nr:hypothetical protein [Lachnospiraceae bacterium]